MNTQQSRRVIQREEEEDIDEIVAELSSSVVNGPPSVTQHETVKMFSSNPDDFSRIRSIKHFQEYVFGITKNSFYFAVAQLERMFPEGASHTKAMLNTFSAVRMLKECGAILSKDAQFLSFNLESFTNPFAGDLAMPASFGSSNPLYGLLMGTKAQQRFPVNMNVRYIWEALSKTGVKSFLSGLVIGFVDEVLAALVPERYKDKLNYIKNLLKGAASIIGTAVLFYMLYYNQVTLVTAMLSVLIGYAGSIVGGAIGAALGRFLKWAMARYASRNEDINISMYQHVDATAAPVNQHVDATNPFNQPHNHTDHPAQQHNCGQDNNGYLHIGLCINCNNQPAVYGFVHRHSDSAHSAFCLSCSANYKKSLCVCGAEISSRFYFSPRSHTCTANTCIIVGDCVSCDEAGIEPKQTACIWRVKKSEETVMTNQTVTLDLRYCNNHCPHASMTDIYRYGRLYASGYV